MSEPILRCTWCCKDTKTIPCEHCDNDMCVTDRTKPHRPEWSRRTVQEVECKVCDRRGPRSIQCSPDLCPGSVEVTPHKLSVTHLIPGMRYVTREGLVTTPLERTVNGTNYKFTARVYDPGDEDVSRPEWLETGEYLHAGTPHRFDLMNIYDPAEASQPQATGEA